MPIIVNLDRILKEKEISGKQLSHAIGITEANLSILRSGKAKAVRFSTLSALCAVLECQPGDILIFLPETKATASPK